MSYQRPSEGRFYIWMGFDGLHIMPGQELTVDVVVKSGAAGRDNAKAMMLGLHDFLSSEGVRVKVKRGAIQFEKADQP